MCNLIACWNYHLLFLAAINKCWSIYFATRSRWDRVGVQINRTTEVESERRIPHKAPVIQQSTEKGQPELPDLSLSRWKSSQVLTLRSHASSSRAEPDSSRPGACRPAWLRSALLTGDTCHKHCLKSPNPQFTAAHNSSPGIHPNTFHPNQPDLNSFPSQTPERL